MSAYIRKFSRGIWEKRGLSEKSTLAEVPADVFSRCMFTDDNKLSLWKTESTDWVENEMLIAAIICGTDGPSRADLVILDEDITNDIPGVEILNNKGETPAEAELNDKHCDLSNLNYASVGKVAEIIVKELINEKSNKVIRYNEKKVLGIVSRAVEAGFIKRENLSDRWRAKMDLSNK